MSKVQITLCHKDDSCASRAGYEERSKWCMVSYTCDTVHTHKTGAVTLSYVALKATALGETKGPRTQPGALRTLIRYCAAWRFMKTSERPGELQLEPLNAWNFGAQGYISQLCLRSSIAWSIKRLHVRHPLQHHTPVSGLICARLP